MEGDPVRGEIVDINRELHEVILDVLKPKKARGRPVANATPRRLDPQSLEEEGR